MKTHIIYKITSTATSKVYIGQTCRKLSTRWSEHKSQASKCVKKFHLHEAMSKYGIDSFNIEEIESVTTQIEANQRECYWIAYYDAVQNGYNICAGPDDHITMGNRSWSALNQDEQQTRIDKLQESRASWFESLSTAEKVAYEEERKKQHFIAVNKKDYTDAVSTRVTDWWAIMSDTEKESLKLKYSQKKSRNYIVTNPEGDEFKIKGLKQFCDEHKLHQGAMNALARGQGKTYKRWKCRYDEQ